MAGEKKPLSRTSKLHFETLLYFSSHPDESPDYVTSVSVSEPAMYLPPVYVDGQIYYQVVFKDRSRYLVHRVSARMEKSFAFSEGYMDYSDALRQAIAEMPPKWDFSTWDYQTQLACSAEETEAIQQYGVAIQRRAYEIVCELQNQRDAAEASRAQTEAGAERKGAQAKESHAPPSSQTHLMQKLSSENAARSLEHQPEQQRTYSCTLTWTSDRTEQEGRFNFEGEEEEEERVCFGKRWETTSNILVEQHGGS